MTLTIANKLHDYLRNTIYTIADKTAQDNTLMMNKMMLHNIFDGLLGKHARFYVILLYYSSKTQKNMRNLYYLHNICIFVGYGDASLKYYYR